MSNAISYSVFGYNNKDHQSLDFKSYLRGLEVNLRVSDLIYPGWKVSVVTDHETYNSPYHNFFTQHQESGKIALTVVDRQPLCMMMLYRMLPLFSGKYDRVICRDSDSLLSYRDAQAVAYWIKGGRIAHAETDSISHTIALMGGMIGFMSKEFKEVIGCNSFEEMIALRGGIDYNKKGADQDFLNSAIYPKVASSITQHYVLGMPQTFMGDCHNHIQNVNLNLPEAYKELDHLGYHLGAAGMRTDHTIDFLKKYGMKNDYYDKIEKNYSDTFYWAI